jgi:hypothetical protein
MLFSWLWVIALAVAEKIREKDMVISRSLARSLDTTINL